MKRIENPGAAVPVLLMNPTDKDIHNMATRRKTTRRRKASPTRRRRAAPARRRRRATTTPRRRVRRRRRNPKFDVKSAIYAAAGGLVAGAAAYAVGQQNLTPTTTAAAIGAGGLLLGAAASGWKPSVGAGIAGAGAAVATLMGIGMWYEKSKNNGATSAMYGMGAVRRMASPHHGAPAMHAVAAPVSAQRSLLMSGMGSTMGAVRAPVSNALEADLRGLS